MVNKSYHQPKHLRKSSKVNEGTVTVVDFCWPSLTFVDYHWPLLAIYLTRDINPFPSFPLHFSFSHSVMHVWPSAETRCCLLVGSRKAVSLLLMCSCFLFVSYFLPSLSPPLRSPPLRSPPLSFRYLYFVCTVFIVLIFKETKQWAKITVKEPFAKREMHSAVFTGSEVWVFGGKGIISSWIVFSLLALRALSFSISFKKIETKSNLQRN